MSLSRKEIRQQLSRDVSVRQGKDQVNISFRYMTPRRAQFANALFILLPIPFYFCLLADAVQAYAWQLGAVRYAQAYLGVIYDIYSYAAQLGTNLFYTLILDAQPESRFSNGILLFGSGLATTVLFAGFLRMMEARDLAPMLLAPIFGSRANIMISPDKIRFSRKTLPYDINNQFLFELSPRTRNKLRRTQFDEQSMAVYYIYGANPILVADVYGIEKASNVASNLNHIHDNLDSFLKHD